MACASAADGPDPVEGTAMEVDAPPDAPVLKTKMLGMTALRDSAKPTDFDNDGASFTLRDLRAVGATPDLTSAVRGEEEDGAADQPWYEEASGVAPFENAILSANAQAADKAATFGTAQDPDDAPTSARPDVTPSTIDAAWELDKLRRSGASAEEITAGMQKLSLAEHRSAAFKESVTEVKELSPEHVAFYLFEAVGKERPCVMADECKCRRSVYHPLHDPPPPTHPGGPSSRIGVTLKEFLTDTERARFDRDETLPDVRRPCMVCYRNYVTFGHIRLPLGLARAPPQFHYHPIECPGGYKRSACIIPRSGGVCLPTRGFATKEYAPITLGDAAEADAVRLTQSERARFESLGMPLSKIRGYVERGSVLFDEATRGMGTQALSGGTEPADVYVGAFARVNKETSQCPSAGDRTSCCDLGEYAGRWRHLVIESSARLGITVETMNLIMGPCGDLSSAIKAAMSSAVPDSPVSEELGLLVRRRREWAIHRPPESLSNHSIYAGCILCKEIAEELKLTVHADAVEIARHKSAARSASDKTKATAAARVGVLKYATWEALAADAEDESGFTDRSAELMETYDTGKDAWDAAKKEAEAQASKAADDQFSSRLIPFPAPTTAQRAIAERIENAEQPALQSLLADRKKKRPSQKTLDRILQVVSEFDSAHRPLRAALVRMREAGLPIDDAALVGGPPPFFRDAFGAVDPDARTPSLRVPRRPTRLTITAPSSAAARAAELRFADSGLPARSMLPAPAAFVVPGLPFCRLRFPSHRKVIRGKLKSGAIAFPLPLLPAGITADVLLKEFWKAVDAVRRMGVVTHSLLLQLLYPDAVFSSERRSLVATAAARVFIAEHVQADAVIAGDWVLAFRAHAFARTHADLLKHAPKSDAELAERAEALYPYDGRVFTAEDAVPIAPELMMCGLFERIADPVAKKTLLELVRKLFPCACEKRELDDILAKTASSCPAFAVWLMGALRCFVMGSYVHAKIKPPFLTAERVCEPFLREAKDDLELRIAEADSAHLAEKHGKKCEKMRAATATLGTQQFWGALAVARLVATAGYCVSALGDGDVDAKPFSDASKRVVAAVAESVCADVARRTKNEIAPDPVAFASRFEALYSGAETLEGSALEPSVRLLGEGALSSQSSEEVGAEAADAIADAVVGDVLAAEGDARCACGATETLDAEKFARRLADGVRASLMRLRATGLTTAQSGVRTWPLSLESVRETCAAACSRALEGEDDFMPKMCDESHRQAAIDAYCGVLVRAAADAPSRVPYLVGGLADVALTAMSRTAGDMSDLWNPCVKMCANPRGHGAKRRVVRSAIRAMDNVPVHPSGISRMVEYELMAVTKSKGARERLAANHPRMEEIASAILGVIESLRISTETWRPAHPASAPIVVSPKTELNAERLILLAGRLTAGVISAAGAVAMSAQKYSDSTNKAEMLRETWESNVRIGARKSPESFALAHTLLCQCAVRAELVRQLSFTPALASAFVTRGSWFPDYVDAVSQTSDEIRWFICREKRIPSEDEIDAIIADVTRRSTWWCNKVYRNHKCKDIASQFVKTAKQHMDEIIDAGYRIGPRFTLDPDLVRVMREYVYATVTAHGADRRPNLAMAKDTLWRFGMREHGLDVVARLHAAFERYAGKSEFYKIVNQFTVTEFLLFLEYARVSQSANSISVTPLLSPSISEATAAALRERHGLGDGDLPREVFEFVVCDVCNSVLTQLSSRSSLRPSKLTSCWGVFDGQDGELYCLGKRNSAKKKTDEEDDAPSLALPLKCQTTPVRRVAGPGCAIALTEKRMSKGEKAREASDGIFIAPCCGTWRRFSPEDWGPDGYRCRGCSQARNTGPALPTTCAICGAENKLSACCPTASVTNKKAEALNKQLTTSRMAQVGGGGCTRTWADLGSMRWGPGPSKRVPRETKMFAPGGAPPPPEEGVGTGGTTILVKSRNKRSSYEAEMTIAGMDGRVIPLIDPTQSVICVLDDDVTMQPIPVGVCDNCFNACKRIASPSSPPMPISYLRDLVRKKLSAPRLTATGVRHAAPKMTKREGGPDDELPKRGPGHKNPLRIRLRQGGKKSKK